MNRAPVVSVVMIFLDEERFIAEAIDSILRQGYADWELLLVDDGSTDRSTEIAREQSARHPDRIRYLEHPGHANLGASVSRNLGLTEARGKYLAFLDADDVWLDDKLAWEVQLLDAHPEVGWLYGQTLVWYSWDPRIAGRITDLLKDMEGVPLDAVIPADKLLALMLRNEYLCPACGSVLLRRSLVMQVGGWNNQFRGQYEDMILYAKLLSAGAAVYVDARVHSRYRQHEANGWVADLAANPWRPPWLSLSRRRYLEWVERFLAQQPGVPREVHAALTFALLRYRQPFRFLLTRSGWQALRQAARPMLKQVVRTIRGRRKRSLPASRSA